jgi:hypothetical protein
VPAPRGIGDAGSSRRTGTRRRRCRDGACQGFGRYPRRRSLTKVAQDHQSHRRGERSSGSRAHSSRLASSAPRVRPSNSGSMLASVLRVADRSKVVIGRVAVAVDLKAAGLGGQPYGLPDVNASAETAAGVTSISISFVANTLGSTSLRARSQHFGFRIARHRVNSRVSSPLSEPRSPGRLRRLLAR